MRWCDVGRASAGGTIIGKGSDGTTLRYHETMHFALNANGDVTVSFDNITVTCG
jgi:hypothetical protein